VGRGIFTSGAQSSGPITGPFRKAPESFLSESEALGQFDGVCEPLIPVIGVAVGVAEGNVVGHASQLFVFWLYRQRVAKAAGCFSPQGDPLGVLDCRDSASLAR